MLRWSDNLLWYGNHILASVVCVGAGNVYLDLLGWDGFGLCAFNYATVAGAKAAAEAWARGSGMALADSGERAARYGDEYGITDDDIPF